VADTQARSLNDSSNRAAGEILQDVTSPAADFPSGATAVVAVAIVISGLYFGRVILVPAALAVLLSFVLAPGVRWLCRWRLGQIPSVLIMVAFAFLVIIGVGTLVGTQLSSLAQNLPQYEKTVRDKIRSFQSAAGAGIIEGASRFLRAVNKQIADPDAVLEPAPGQATVNDTEPKPIPVLVQQPGLKPLEVIQTILGPVLERLATAGLVLVLVIFILLKRDDLRDRLIRLAGVRDLHRSTQALTDAAERVSRYLLMQTAINATFAVPVGVGLWLIGVPNPVLWGIMAMVLRFVPYIGPLLAAAAPIALSVAVDPGWSMLAWTAALFLALELISNNIIEPWLYGSSTGLSPVAIILAATFWTWLWGPIGLVLSTPLTSCLVVLGRHVPQLRFLEVALGDRPVLTPEEGLYLRLLAGDPSGASAQAEEYLKLRSLPAFYDDVLIPALALAQQDVRRGVLEGKQRAQMRAVVEELLDDMSGIEDSAAEPGQALTATTMVPKGLQPEAKQIGEKQSDDAAVPRDDPADLPQEWQGWPVLCIASRTDLDEAPAAMLAQLLGKHGIGARVLPWEAVSVSNVKVLDASGVQMVCLSCLDPRLSTHVRFLIRRLRRKFPQTSIIVGFWTLASDATGHKEIAETGADLVARSLREAVEQVCRTAGEARQRAADHLESSR